MSWLREVKIQLDAVGLNVSGTAPGEYGEVLLPGCAAVVVFASGGTLLWESFLDDVRAHPEHLTGSDHPLDDYVARQIARVDARPPTSRRWIRCGAKPEGFLDFRPLARAAGLGWPSRLGLLLHPEFGPWIGLRAACLTTEALPVDEPLPEEGPCETCDAPCASACPGGAFQQGPLDIHRCAAFHVESEICHGRCDARLACPQGAIHRHAPLQHHYHNARLTGRKLLAEACGIYDDPRKGQGPEWRAWASARK
jgi:epoxyqueuosine reductase